MRKFLLVLLIAVILSACGNEANVDSQKESADATEKAEVTLSEDEAKEIVNEKYDLLISSINDDDLELFKAQIDMPSLGDEVSVDDIYMAFKNLFSSYSDTNFENKDIEIVYQGENILGASINEYVNLKSGDDYNTASRNMLLHLRKVDGDWKLSQNEENLTAYNDFTKDIYGEEFAEDGFINTDPLYLFNNVYLYGVNVGVHSAKVNSADQTVDVNIAVANGFDNDIFDISFNKLVLYSGLNQPIPFADLTGYELDPTEVIHSKDLLIIPINIKAEDLLVPIDAVDTMAVYVDSSTDWKNRD